MESLKPLQDVLAPDTRSAGYVVINSQTGEHRPFTIDDLHARLSRICLNQSVPEDLRSYFETIKNVFLYGWFVYTFYTVAMFLSFTAIEMALRIKFQQDDPDHRWSFKKLIETAKSRGLITDDGFVSVKERRMDLDESMDKVDVHLGPPAEDYCAILVQSIPHLRNFFAHPQMDAIALPSNASSTMTLAAEFINQLFPDSSTAT